MNPDKWDQIKWMIKDSFKIKREEKEKLEDGVGEKEIVEFEGPIGLVRMEYVERPRVLDKKTQYSRRIGGDVKVDYVYSDTEKVYNMTAYLWSEEDDDWKEIDAKKLGV